MPRRDDDPTSPAPMGRLLLTQVTLLVTAAAITALTLLYDIASVPERMATGLLALVLLTALVGIARGSQEWSPGTLLVVPVVDLLVVGHLRVAAPTSGFGFMLILPVAWLAAHGGRYGGVVGAVAGTLVAWAPLLLSELGVSPGPVDVPTVAATASVTIVLLVLSAVLSAGANREAAQRRLLDQQARHSEAAYRQARRDEDVLAAIMDAVPFGVVSVDEHRAYLGSNRAARAMLRHLGLPMTTSADQLPLYHLDGETPVSAEDRPHVRGLAGEPVEAEVYWVGHRDQPRMAVEISGRLVLHEDGSVDRLVLVLRDVDESVEAEAARDQAIASVSHEFRTPLSSILGFIELAADTPGLPEEAAEHLVVAERNTTRLLTLVGDLLATRHRAIHHAVPLSLRRVDLAEVVEESVTALRIMATDRLLTVTVDSPGPTPILGDDFRLRQVVDNLVTNAIKYNVDGGSISIALTCDDDEATLTVADTGPGMSERERVEVFEPYYRTSNAANSTVPGTGLGLGICREIVTQHGGTIRLDDRGESGGTVAVLRLPRDGRGAAT
ncbi:MAG: HAMP domain-containing sensor histidine kinase [Aeromicrobium sp.]|uniref:sensor histidine kinase n=1 Tax=Aeromicrobium sp. TaxID=1871063 RepID=UPI0039E31CEB